MAAFALTIFTGAFLLFQVQPLIAKFILPWFGGAPAVWTTCLLFFQTLLLGGYAYAHLSSRWLKPRGQAILHLCLLGAALATLPIVPSESWKPAGDTNPTWRIMALLAVTVGLPYFVLSTTGPLMQSWFSRTNPGRSPYRLYALSNVGSLLALLSYPAFFESHFTRKTQATLWAGGLVAFVLCCAWCAIKLVRTPKSEDQSQVPSPKSQVPSQEDSPRSDALTLRRSDAPHAPAPPSTTSYPLSTKLLWLLLPACASVLLLATTNKMCQDVAVIPFLWVLPLALYLLSFIICFDSPRWYRRLPFTVALFAALGWVCWALPKGTETPLRMLLAGYSLSLFVVCMFCHGEVYRLKPDPKHLTSFYLMISAGGALGGLLVAVAAPRVFNDFHELPLGFLIAGVLCLAVWVREYRGRREEALTAPAQGNREEEGDADQNAEARRTQRMQKESELCGGRVSAVQSTAPNSTRPARKSEDSSTENSGLLSAPDAADEPSSPLLGLQFSIAAMGLGLLVAAGLFWAGSHPWGNALVEQTRNFYGCLTVLEDAKDDPMYHNFVLRHGSTLHGVQFTHPTASTYPTLYFGRKSGAGLAIASLPPGARRIGVIGLGAGTLAAYGRTNDYIRFYEINPQVMQMASKYLTYAGHSLAKVDCVIGDARLSLEHEPGQQFDLLALDAFSGDSIPAHLLTTEALAVYNRHMNTNGIIACHISNNYLDLEPPLVNAARELHYQVAVIENMPGPEEWFCRPSMWVLLSRSADALNAPKIKAAARPPEPNCERVPLWTDDFTSLFQVLR